MKFSKKLLSLLLCAVMVPGSVAVGGGVFAEVLDAFSVKASAAKVTSYSQGDIIEFGWYPQSEETNTSITDALTSSAGNTLGWNSYDYYSGTGEWDDGQMTPSDYMRYTDVMYDGAKYRGVIFDSYRPYCTGYTSSDIGQQSNGYYTGTVYWFKYEPIKWRVLDPATGMVMAETILDSQAFNNYVLYANSEYYGNSAKTYYANNYTESSIRKWLNDDFYNTAFSPAQQNIIQNTTLDNSAYSTSYSEYNSESTNDKIYLLSYNDTLNADYGFSTSTGSNSSRKAQGSDYAKCQGLDVCNDGDEYDGNSFWRLRSPGGSSSGTCRVYYDGCVSSYYGTYSTLSGVRPALNFNLSSETFQSDVKDTGTASGSGTGTAAASGTGSDDGWADSTHIRFGSYPQTDVTASMGSTLDAKATDWKSYKYYSGTGDSADGRMSSADGQMSSADYMMYCDVTVMNGFVPEEYRGVKFSTYRPEWTEDESTTSASTYQDDNGYTVGNTYWFKYEPLVWRVLDSSTGLVMCESIIDSQAYNNYIWYGAGSKSTSSEYYGNEAHTNYANDYYNSSIRKWLTEDFYATAFSESQQNKLLEYNCGNSCPWASSFDSQNSSDKVFLLSYDEVKTTAYGFNSSASNYDPARRTKGTDYARCQGLYVCNDGNEYDGNSFWWLRSPYDYSAYACDVDYDGISYYYYCVNIASGGVRPALKLNLTSDIFQSDVTDTETAAASGTGSDDGWADSTHIRFGSYPQTEVTDSATLSVLNKQTLIWQSYGYYTGTGSIFGNMQPSNYMQYADVSCDTNKDGKNEKYRAVQFSLYRPYCTGYRSTTLADTYQDNNGYSVGNTYWFKYEPLVWRVLDSSTGLVMCESIIDSQAYNNYMWCGTSSEYWYGNEAHTNYANDYYNSSIRKWLTEDFYATAFSESQQNNLLKYNCDNRCCSSSHPEYDSQNSSDKVFLLSYDEVKTTAYGLSSSYSTYDTSREAKGTDYAKCQGLWVNKSSGSEYDGNSLWWLRSPDGNSFSACVVYCGDLYNGDYHVGYTSNGVRPALRLNLLEIMKAEAKAELAEAKMNAVSDEAKAAIDTAIENVDKATNPDAVASAKAEGTRNAAEADEALADAIAEAKEALADAKEEATSDEAKAAIDEAIEALDNAKNLDAVADEKAKALDDAAAADEALADAIEDAQEALEEAKAEATSDEAKNILDEAIEALNDATSLDEVADEKAKALDDAAAADEALADAKAEVIDAIEEAAGDDRSAALRSVVNNGERAVNNATSVEGVEEALANALDAIEYRKKVDGFRCPDKYHLLKYKGTVTLLAESKTDKVIYTTSDPTVATVDETGKVTAVGKGKCVITASVEGTDISKDVDIEVKYCCCDIILYYILRIFNFMKKIFNLIFAC